MKTLRYFGKPRERVPVKQADYPKPKTYWSRAGHIAIAHLRGGQTGFYVWPAYSLEVGTATLLRQTRRTLRRLCRQSLHFKANPCGSWVIATICSKKIVLLA